MALSHADNDILCSLHRYRPQFLAKSSGLPFYYEPYDFRHVCLLECQPSTDAIALVEDDEHNETKKCLAMPFVSSCHFQCQSVAEKFANIIKEVISFAWLFFFPVGLIICNLTVDCILDSNPACRSFN